MAYVSATCLILFLASASAAMCTALIYFTILAFPDFLTCGYLIRYYMPMLYLTTSFVTTIYFEAFLPDTLLMLP